MTLASGALPMGPGDVGETMKTYLRRLSLSALALTLLAPLAAVSPAAAADTYAVDLNHSEVGFQVRHLISTVRGRFDAFEGMVTLDPKNPSASSVNFVIQTPSINTFNDQRDGHLRNEDFFDVEKYPEITFKSSKFERGSDGIYNVTGNLTMHGVSKVVTLPVTFLGEMADPWGKTRAGFATSITLNRKDYGINWNKALDQGGVMLGDDVKIEINLETIKQPAEKAAE